MNQKTIGYILVAVGAYLVWGKETVIPSSSGTSGIGVGGQRRYGQPKTDAERRAQHLSRFGTEELPPRGSGGMF